MNHSFNIEIAKRLDVNQAIIIENMAWWLKKNLANNRHIHDGSVWTYNSVNAFSELFPYWSKDQVRRILEKMESNNVIKVGNYNKVNYDRTKWYSVSAKWILSIYQIDLANLPNGICESAKPIPVINTNINTVVNIERETKRFQPPTIQQIDDYIFEKTGRSDLDEAENFFNYYESNGWMVGKTKMKKWKNSLAGWLKRSDVYNKQNPKRKVNDGSDLFDIANG